MAKYYGGQGYLSVWLGDCESQELLMSTLSIEGHTMKAMKMMMKKVLLN